MVVPLLCSNAMMQHLPGNIEIWSRIVRVHCVRNLYSNGSASCRLTSYWEQRYSPTNCNCADSEFEIDRLTVEHENCAVREFQIDRLTVRAKRSSCCRTVWSRGSRVLAVARRLTLLSSPDSELSPVHLDKPYLPPREWLTSEIRPSCFITAARAV